MITRGTQPGTELREQLLHTRPRGSVARAPTDLLPRTVARPPRLRGAAWRVVLSLGGLALLSSTASLLVLKVLSKPSTVSYAELWLVFALVAPLTWLAGLLVNVLKELRAHACFVVVSLRSTGCKWERCLMDALIAELRKGTGSPCSCAVVETGDEDEEGKSKWQVSLLPMLTGASIVLTNGQEQWEVLVTLQQKDPVICGRAQEPRRAESATLAVQTSSWCEFLRCCLDFRGHHSEQVLSRQQRARLLVMLWLQVILEIYTKQKPGQVEVFELQQEYKDYRPTWELIRRESCCSTRAAGLAHYTQQPWAQGVRRQVDFALGCGGHSRLALFISGQKGSGKTIFVEWLAGELQAPVYHIDLRSPGINDAVLRDSIARNRLRHNPPVLFHFDEFQAPLQQWLVGEAPADRPDGCVTIEGLQCMLEGIATPNNAVFIFTSSMDLPVLEEVPCARLRAELQGLLRRFSCVVHIPQLDRGTAEGFMEGFLRGYVHFQDWGVVRQGQGWQSFAAAWKHWEPEVGVPFDMLSKYAERAVRDFVVAGSRGFRPPNCRSEVQPAAPEEEQEALLAAVFNPKAVEAFFEEYAGGAYVEKLRSVGGPAGSTLGEATMNNV